MEEEKKWIVYMHTTPNEKKYIGVTSVEPKKRWGPNGCRYKGMVFYNAIEKYGWDNIKHEILFEGLTQDEASQKEIEMIDFYKSNVFEHGYNISPGGLNDRRITSPETKQKMSENRQGVNAHGWGYSPSEMARKMISNKIKGIKRSKDSKEKMAKKKKKPVYQYNKDGILLHEWESAKQVCDIKGYNHGNIGSVCHFRDLLAEGFFWSFEKITNPELIKKYLSKEIIIPILKGGKTKRVIQYDLDGNQINMYNSISEASLNTGITSQQIGYACSKNTVAGIFKWKYDDSKEYYGDSYFMYWVNHQDDIDKNMYNSKRYINNTSKKTGITWDKNRNKWIVKLHIIKRDIF